MSEKMANDKRKCDFVSKENKKKIYSIAKEIDKRLDKIISLM